MKSKFKILLIVGYSVSLIFSSIYCTDPLPSKIDPYDFLRTDWNYVPSILRTDTLEVLVTGSISSSIQLVPYLVNEFDEWIVDTTYVEVHYKITLLNKPEVFGEFTSIDTVQIPEQLLPGDSAWHSITFNHRLQGNHVTNYLGANLANENPNRYEWEIARYQVEGTIKLFKNVLPQPLPKKEFRIVYWQPIF